MRFDALIVLTAASTVTGDLVELVTVTSVEVVELPPRIVEKLLPAESIIASDLPFAFLTVRLPLPIVKITSEPLRVVLETAAPREILSPVA